MSVWCGTKKTWYFYQVKGAEGGTRTLTELPPTVFETAASTIPPPRLAKGSLAQGWQGVKGSLKSKIFTAHREKKTLSSQKEK